MATLEQLAEGIRRADAAGNVEDVKALGAAYRALQAQGQQPGQTPTLNPYTDGNAVQLKGKVSDLPSQRPSLADEAMSFGRGVIEGIPVAGPFLADARRGLDANVAAAIHGGNAGDYQDQYKAADEALRDKTGGARFVGNVAGSVAALAPLGATQVGGRLLGMTGSLPSRLLAGAGSGGVLSGADTAARGGDLTDIATNAAFGTGLGAVLPAIGGAKNALLNKAAQAKATKAAIAGAPDASNLKSAASSMFKQVDEAGVMVEPQALAGAVSDLLQEVKRMRINPTLDPKATASYRELVAATREALNGKPMTFGDLHNLRQIAQKAAMSSEGRDQMFSEKIIDMLDGFITRPSSAVTADGPANGNLLLTAISTWSRAKRVSLLEQAIERAKNAASGFENGLRVEFRKLLNNKKTSTLFNEVERDELKRVVLGTTGANLMKLLGKFGFGAGNASNMLGGSIGTSIGASLGSALGPLGTAAGAAIAGGGATLARRASEKITANAAERAAKVVATPNVPVVAPRPLLPAPLAPALLPLNTTRKQPIEITVRGGANSR